LDRRGFVRPTRAFEWTAANPNKNARAGLPTETTRQVLGGGAIEPGLPLLDAAMIDDRAEKATAIRSSRTNAVRRRRPPQSRAAGVMTDLQDPPGALPIDAPRIEDGRHGAAGSIPCGQRMSTTLRVNGYGVHCAGRPHRCFSYMARSVTTGAGRADGAIRRAFTARSWLASGIAGRKNGAKATTSLCSNAQRISRVSSPGSGPGRSICSVAPGRKSMRPHSRWARKRAGGGVRMRGSGLAGR
jgi:hypothetical protein